jgi:CDP-diacylglycerol---glycerol-3-phosphate 3-phosphatidyltransferase
LLSKGVGATGHLSLFPPMLNFAASLNAGDYLLLTADILVVLAVIWTVLSGAEYLIGALPIFTSESQPEAVKS